MHLPAAGRFILNLKVQPLKDMVSISTLAKRTGVSSKTLRYWESRGLLPKAARSHTGYRLFDPGAAQYVEFIQKSKSVGLSLKEIAEVFRVARNGGSPCPDVVTWAKQKAEEIEHQIKLLSRMHRRLRHFTRLWSTELPCTRVRPEEICCLIESLPAPKSPKGGERYAKAVAGLTSRTRRAPV